MNALNFLQAGQNESQLLMQDYTRERCQSSVIHLGVGAFHRAHQAVFFDRLMALDDGASWGITGVNIRPNDSKTFAKLIDQQGEYILKTMDFSGATHFEHIRSILTLIDGAQSPLAVDELMADTAIQLITCTVTEGGYYLDENQQLMLQHPDISGDLKGERNTLYAFLYAGLKARSKQNKTAAITLLCCDNLRENGHLLRAGLLQFIAAKGDNELGDWLAEHASFPCSMVDRITPKPDVQHISQTQSYFAVDDEMTVMAEDYMQWVIEDDFAGKRPHLDLVGVEFVEDVTPYEEAKIRILNAGHTCVAYRAALKGLTYFDQAMADVELNQYFTDFIKQDSIPAIGSSVVDLDAYANTIAMRFSNANIGDTVERICTDGYAKFPIFVYPTLAGIYQLGGIPAKTIEAIACWFVFIHQVAQGKLNLTYHEPNLACLAAFTNDEKGVHAFVTDTYLWQNLPIVHPDFVTRLKAAIHQAQLTYAE